MSSSEILAALNALQTHVEGQIHATNQTLQEFRKSVDSRFEALRAKHLPARSGSQQRRWGANNDISPFLPTAPLQPPGSAAPPPFLSFDITSAAASISIAAATTSAAASISIASAAASTSIAAATTSAAASTSFSAAPPPPAASPTPSPSAVFSPPSPPPSAASPSPSPSAVACPPSVADSPLPLGSGVVLNRAGFAAPPPFLSPTTILAAPPAASGVNLTELGPDELFDKTPSPAPGPAPEITPQPNSHFRPMSSTQPPTAPSAFQSPTKVALLPPLTTTISFTQFQVVGHSTKVGQILENILWPSPSDLEAQSNSFNKYQDDAAVAYRRGVIFSLYALEEVYKDILESLP